MSGWGFFTMRRMRGWECIWKSKVSRCAKWNDGVSRWCEKTGLKTYTLGLFAPFTCSSGSRLFPVRRTKMWPV